MDYADKRIIDVGCNMGVIAYEIAKLRPKSIHGLDVLHPHITVARRLFQGSAVESRFDRINLGSRKLPSLLAPEYDIALLLAVYHHMVRSLGEERAKGALAHIVSRCSTVVARVPNVEDGKLQTELERAGFCLGATHHSPRGSTLLVYERQH
ncbi:class I SAM-dependent methyltransferase [Mesorhizobium sp. ORS 3428]|uniref:class I SAM-dependent methyltransferase n=1 Tax=Mesorhizobium sp. ORS 3428 TaxID=540997 RepID=UPI0010424668|nr:class I SAM-dependent methyltransferase [Mesorhizobium sp. ORS 3428]